MTIQFNRRAKTDIPVWKWFVRGIHVNGDPSLQTPYKYLYIEEITTEKAVCYKEYGGYHCFASCKGALKYIPYSQAKVRGWYLKKLYIPRGALYHEGIVRSVKNYEIPCLGAKELRFKRDLKK